MPDVVGRSRRVCGSVAQDLQGFPCSGVAGTRSTVGWPAMTADAAEPPRVAPSYSTGGGGTVLEHRYGAVLLSALLTGAAVTVRTPARIESHEPDTMYGMGAEILWTSVNLASVHALTRPRPTTTSVAAPAPGSIRPTCRLVRTSGPL